MKRSPLLRKVNAIVAGAMVVCLFIHAVGNAFQLIGIGTVVPRALAYVLLAAAIVHLLIGIVLTVDTVRTQKAPGASYFGLNKRFWVSRISGLAIAVFIICHIVIFGHFGPSDGSFRLSFFGQIQLVLSLLLVASLAVHILSGLQPLSISLGLSGPRARAVDVGIVVCILLVFLAIAFFIYFSRWSIL